VQYDIGLAFELLQGVREAASPDTPEDYEKIYTGKYYYLKGTILNCFFYNFFFIFFFLECWSGEPDERPTIDNVVVRLYQIIEDKFSCHKRKNHKRYSNNLSNLLTLNTNNKVSDEQRNVTETVRGELSVLMENFYRIDIDTEINLSNEIVDIIFEGLNKGEENINKKKFLIILIIIII
jgi:hypothetical protein